jgi:hypothetical protein
MKLYDKRGDFNSSSNTLSRKSRSGISAIYIYTPYAGVAGMLLYINGKSTMGKLKSPLLS